jgi:hypothetical protein
MTRFVRPSDGQKVIKWDPGDPVDWTTPDSGDGISDEYCGNCGLDVPCGCPRDKDFEGDASALPVQERGDPPLPYEYRGPIP